MMNAMERRLTDLERRVGPAAQLMMSVPAVDIALASPPVPRASDATVATDLAPAMVASLLAVARTDSGTSASARGLTSSSASVTTIPTVSSTDAVRTFRTKMAVAPPDKEDNADYDASDVAPAASSGSSYAPTKPRQRQKSKKKKNPVLPPMNMTVAEVQVPSLPQCALAWLWRLLRG